tara:strand:+ start:1293 stop:5726 length:4434 start_codon:yes stop_codon:yes gene_type:complete
MADNKITIDIEVNGKMQKATLSTKKLRKQLDELEGTQDKVTKGASNLSRNMQGASKRTSNTTKEFSKLQQGMGGVVGIYATIAAQVFAVSAAFQFLKNASDVTNLIAGQEALGSISGVAYKTLTAGIREATAGQISFAEASRAAAIGTASGLNPEQLNGLANAAKNASIALGRDLTDSFNRLIRGTTKAEPELLDELGIVLRLDTALGKYAQQLGKSAGELSAFERSQAVANEVLEQANTKFGALEKNLKPGTFALNQFLNSFDELINAFKVGVIDTLRPVFVFLSQNTGALAASLALFALPIAKAIIPNLEDWRESAEKTLEAQKGRYADLSKEAKGYSLDLATLGKEEKEIRRQADEAAKKAGGPKATKTTGALAFLQGTGDQTAAQAKNADKVLKHAEMQIATSAKKRTGILKHMNAQQVADMRRSYNLRMTILKKHNVTELSNLKKLSLAHKIAAASIGASYQKMATLVSRASIQMSRVMNAAFAATGIIGLIFLIKDLGSMLLDAFIPGRKALKELQDEVDDTAKSYDTLTKELVGIKNAMRDTDVSLVQRLEQLANAANTANLDKLIQDFKDLENAKPGVETDKLRASLEGTLDEVTEINPTLGELTRRVIEGGEGADEARKDYLNYKNMLIEAGAAQKQLADASRATQAELDKLSESAKPTSVLDGVNSLLKAELALSDARIKGLNASIDASQAVKEAKQAEFDSFVGEAAPAHGNEGDRAKRERLQRNKDAKQALQDQIDAQDKILAQDNAMLLEINMRNLELEHFNKTINQAVEANREFFDISIEKGREANAIRSNGLSLQGKLNNLKSGELKAEGKVAQLTGARNVAAQTLAAAQAETASELQRRNIPNLQQALALEEQKLAVAQKDLELLREKNTLQSQLAVIESQTQDMALGQKRIDIEKELLSVTQKRIATLGQIAEANKADAARQIKLEAERRSVGNPFFDQEQFIRKETLELEKSTLEQRINQARLESQIKRDQINLEFKLNKAKRQQTILELEKFKQEEVARLKEAGRGGDLVYTVTSINSLINDLESIDFKGPRDAALALETTLLNAKEAEMRGVVSSLEVATEKAEGINQVLETAGGAFRDGLGDAIGATFDVITGKTSSLKDALAGIAQDVLQTVQDKFIEEMFVRPIMESGFFGDQKKDFTPEQIAQTAQQGVQQGIVDGGKALATEVKTAAEGVAEVIKEGGRLAGEQIQSSGCLNLCKDEQTVSQRTGMDTGEVTAATIPEETVKSADVLQEITVPEREKKKDADGNIIGEDGNAGESPLDGLKSVLGENIAATGLLVGTVLGNTTIGEKIQKVSAALLAIDMIMKILAKLGLISEKANTTALIANTAATLKAAATNLFFKDGGLVSDKVSAYNTGGIAKGPRSGYPAVLHGNEAVVPLPDGRTIPVTMQGGGGGQQNNVTVNVNVDNEGGASSSVSQTDGKMASELGNLVAVAVQKELQNQKRSGGILSPYGVA